LTDGTSKSTQWKTAPLIGLRHLRGYLHDGRAKTITDAIMAHGGEGAAAAAAFAALSPGDQQTLLDFVGGL
jgi:CxxC motif-containing protein (DUF1111 family)